MNFYEGSYAEDGTRLCRVCSKPKAYLNKAKEWVCKLCRPSKVAPRDVPEYKLCKGCDTLKSSRDFHSDLRNKDGLQTLCKLCYKEDYKGNKVKRSKQQKEWKALNKHKLNFYQSFRRTLQLNATPKWLSEDQKAEIEYKYWLAKDLTAISGESYEVDHIIPLVNKVVSGLHVPWNLQVLPADLNREKSNKLEEN